ncbi:hypothetical protein AB0N50_28915 [Streptomyces pharetrae]|uniref:LppU/SCO3897 family protein n=1 Tax=Streptomyces pharetrae TaxID=291370 RepID=UPI0034612A4A
MSQTAQQPGAGARGCRAALAAAGAVLLAAGCTNQADDNAGGSSSPGSTPYESPYESPGASPYEPPADDPYPATPTDDPFFAAPTETEEPPDPYTSGTCLDGELPDSTTAQSVDDIDEVACDAPGAHYKVIETFPFTSDMSRCESNPQTQYAFSSRYTLNGTTINEYVYCLIGLGAYAR